MITADEIEAVTFGMRAAGHGYDTAEVDAVLEAAAATVHAYERGVPPGAHREPVLLASHAHQVSFDMSTDQPGYDPASVDALMVELADALEHYEAVHAGPQLSAAGQNQGMSGRELLDAISYARAVRPGGLSPLTDAVRVVGPDAGQWVVESVAGSPDGIIVTVRPLDARASAPEE